MTPLPITVGSLFSGIGGFDLGVERAGCRVAWQVEIDPWCRNILAKHWPDLPRYEDVREVGAHNLDPVDWIVGGFPCQDISTSGRQDGLEGARSGLWWEFHRIIGELRPQIVIVENVANLLHLGIESVLGSLADLGYDAEWDIISAADIGARHIRKRIWIVAMGDTDCSVLERGDACGDTEISRSPDWAARPGKDLADTHGMWKSQPQRSKQDFRGWLSDCRENGGPCQEWLIEPKLGRVAHGIPDRIHRLKGLGNAVVPQIVEMIARRIRNLEGVLK